MPATSRQASAAARATAPVQRCTSAPSHCGRSKTDASRLAPGGDSQRRSRRPLPAVWWSATATSPGGAPDGPDHAQTCWSSRPPRASGYPIPRPTWHTPYGACNVRARLRKGRACFRRSSSQTAAKSPSGSSGRAVSSASRRSPSIRTWIAMPCTCAWRTRPTLSAARRRARATSTPRRSSTPSTRAAPTVSIRATVFSPRTPILRTPSSAVASPSSAPLPKQSRSWGTRSAPGWPPRRRAWRGSPVAPSRLPHPTRSSPSASCTGGRSPSRRPSAAGAAA